MTPDEIRQLVDAIITMPTPEAAAELVQENLPDLVGPTCAQTSTQMIAEERRQYGVTLRHRALTRLDEHVSALFRNQLRWGGGAAPEVVPELIVVTGDNATQPWDTDKEAWSFPQDSFDSWLDLVRPTTPGVVAGPDEGPLGDRDAFSLLRSIENRLLGAAMNCKTDEDIERCREIVRDCDRLLADARPTYFPLDRDRVRGMQADAIKYMALAYDSQGKAEYARRHFRRAVDLFDEIGMPQKARRCLADGAWVQFNQEGNVDGAVETLVSILNVVPEHDLEHVEYLIELGQLHGAAGEDYDAEQFLKRAEQELANRELANPTGAALADALTRSLESYLSGAGPDDPAGWSTFAAQHDVRTLYRRLYTALQRIYLSRGEIAESDRYVRLLEAMDGTIIEGSQANTEFTERMLSEIPSLLQKWDPFTGNR